MKRINDTVPLGGALRCTIYLGSYFNMPLNNQEEIEAANKTLNLAFDCLNAEGVPFYKEGCHLKYQIDKDKLIPSVYTDENTYKSYCYSKSAGYFYPEDQEIFIAKKYNKNLREFESSKGDDSLP